MASLAQSFATWILAEPLGGTRGEPRRKPERRRGGQRSGASTGTTAAHETLDWQEDGEPDVDPATPDPGYAFPPPPQLDLAAQRAALAATLTTGRELLRRHQRETISTGLPTGIASLDQLLGGGLPRRCLVELVGGASSGRLATVLAVLAATTTRGEVATLVDLGDALAPRDALACGVDLARLLWLRPTHLRTALAAAETTLQGGFPLVIVELGLPPVPGGRGAEAAWLRLARAAASHDAALLVASPYRATGTAAEVVLGLDQPGAIWRSSDPAPSYRSTVAVDSTRPQPAVRRQPPRGNRSPGLLAGLSLAAVLRKRRGEGDTERRRQVPIELRVEASLLPHDTVGRTARAVAPAAAERVPAPRARVATVDDNVADPARAMDVQPSTAATPAQPRANTTSVGVLLHPVGDPRGRSQPPAGEADKATVLVTATTNAEVRESPPAGSPRLRPASATARRGWRAQAPRALSALGQRLRASELGVPVRQNRAAHLGSGGATPAPVAP